MRQRLYTAFIGIPVLAGALLLGNNWVFVAIVCAAGLMGALEFFRALRHIDIKPALPVGILWTLLFIVSPAWDSSRSFPILLLTAMVAAFAVLVARKSKEKLFANWLWTIGGILYIGWLLSYFPALRGFSSGGISYGREAALFVLFCTFACDSSAFLIGRTWGKHLWVPSISPKKTWEGAAAGFLAAIIAAVFLSRVLSLPLSLPAAAAAGALVGTFGQIGDLFESVFKRGVGIKDAGKLLPGHGGMMDRLDSLVFTGCVVYYFLVWLVP